MPIWSLGETGWAVPIDSVGAGGVIAAFLVNFHLHCWLWFVVCPGHSGHSQLRSGWWTARLGFFMHVDSEGPLLSSTARAFEISTGLRQIGSMALQGTPGLRRSLSGACSNDECHLMRPSSSMFSSCWMGTREDWRWYALWFRDVKEH